MRRRDFITLLGGAAAWPVAAHAQRAALPLVGFISGRAREDSIRPADEFRKGLGESGITEGQNAAVEYHWLDGQYDQSPALIADLIRRRAAVIATPGNTPAALAAKAATKTIPIVFGVGQDPVKVGLVASLARPGGNATGINFLLVEVASKQLSLLRDLLPKASRLAVLYNPSNADIGGTTLREIHEAAPTLGFATQVIEANTVLAISAAFDTLARERPDALFIGPDAFLGSRRVQIAILAAQHSIPTFGQGREAIEAGQLMAYGTDTFDMYRQVGAYAGRILKGAKPADLPVQQSTKFEFVINVSTAKALGIDIPPALLLRADEVIE
jgi:putative ABC transport system substrate-binding protein